MGWRRRRRRLCKCCRCRCEASSDFALASLAPAPLTLARADFGPGAERQIVDAALEADKRSVLGKLQGFFRIKTLAPNVCRVTFVLQGSLGGSFTKQAMAWAVKSTLGMVKTLQDKYMRNGTKVDAEMCGAFLAPPHRRSLTSEQVQHGNSPSPPPYSP